MPGQRRVAAVDHPHLQPAAERAILIVLAAGLLLTAVIVSSGSDHFRLPKELVFRAEAIVLLALAVFWATAKRRTWRLAPRPAYVIVMAVVAWAAITTTTSTNRPLSVESLITVIAASVIFIATCLAAQTATLAMIDVLMIGCVVNAIVVILQELKIWSPLPAYPGAGTHFGSVGLLGNPNDVGTYLAAPAVAAFAVAVTSVGRRRQIYVAIGVLLVGGIAASATRTAVVAVVAGLAVFGIVHSRRAAAIVLAGIAVLALVVALPFTTLGRNARTLASAAVHRNPEQLFSERLVPFLAAADMVRDHPLVGVGPGCFKYHFMPYRVGLFGRYPDSWTKGFPMNWGDVHNDQLQVAAETGLPGWALFVAAIVVLAWRRKRREPATPQAALAQLLRWPLVVVVIIISLAQFPMELAATRLMLLTLCALSIGWDDDHVDA